MRKRNVSKKVLLSLAALGSAAAIAGLGTFATFTSTTSADHSVSSGTVAIALGDAGTAANRLSVVASDVVPGDTIQRSVDLISSSTDGLSAVELTTTPDTSSLLDTDATDGLQMVVDECSVPWTETGTAAPFTYTCSGSTNVALATGPVIQSGADLVDLSVLSAPGTSHLRITLTLPTTADNDFQNLTSVVDYSFTATQRAATDR